MENIGGRSLDRLSGVGVIPGDDRPDGISNLSCDKSWPLALAASLKRTKPALTEDMDDLSVMRVPVELTDGLELPLDITAGEVFPCSIGMGLAVIAGGVGRRGLLMANCLNGCVGMSSGAAGVRGISRGLMGASG